MRVPGGGDLALAHRLPLPAGARRHDLGDGHLAGLGAVHGLGRGGRLPRRGPRRGVRGDGGHLPGVGTRLVLFRQARGAAGVAVRLVARTGCAATAPPGASFPAPAGGIPRVLPKVHRHTASYFVFVPVHLAKWPRSPDCTELPWILAPIPGHDRQMAKVT
ncbi:hypothetical protein Psi01_68440 [Planobispora siamensis]|uniref:Uncharacterized protein n=1 Tax=Planobispora siamensis TaxID=936338 RepID=A0A8J3WMA1_9ACTN|nr:hypothetical protein Psi01_68440 [Planobispora siamensis]